ncbi:MAG: dTMP kinase [Deltaproteobacteria bacterium]|nr:dTMP kinase [Deltaproteobacteria bacterium]
MVGFITFEGGDGTGKSTQIGLLETYLIAQGKNCTTTREPGGTSLGQLLRQALLEVGMRSISSSTELFLYLADRAQHVREVIVPAVAQGKIVLCDRYTDSTMAYQGYGRGIDLRLLVKLNEIASGGLKPDITFLLDCPVEIGLSRTVQRKLQTPGHSGQDRFEDEKLEFHEKVRQGFLELARAEPERVCLVDASRPEQEVFAAIKEVVDRRMGY